jgi:membrane fusion protein, multidrug efflux system
VTQIDPIWVNFGIPDSDAARLQREAEAGRLTLPKGGFEVQLRLSDGSMFARSGRLNFSDVRVNPSTGTREARAEVPNPNGGALRPGQFVRVVLKGGVIPNAVTVPQRAVLESPQGGKFVYVVDEKSTAAQRPVEAGEWSGESWIITSGLKAGEKVITDGLMKLGPGAPVRIAEKQEPEQQKPQAKK